MAKAAHTDLVAKAAIPAMEAEETTGFRGVSVPHGDQVVEIKARASPEQPSVDPREGPLSDLPKHLRLGACLPWCKCGTNPSFGFDLSWGARTMVGATPPQGEVPGAQCNSAGQFFRTTFL